MSDCLPLVSVIIPIYNAEAFLDKCLRSVLEQSYSHIEIILVDDGSSDCSVKICKCFSEQDKRIKLLLKDNEGVSKARQLGFANSNGEWILFADSDDVLPHDAIEKLVHVSGKYSDVDIVIGGYQYVPKSKFQQYYKEDYFSGENLIVQYLNGSVHTGPWGKLFRKKTVCFSDFNLPPNIKMGEDAIMNVRIARRISKVAVIGDVVYFYCINPTSVCQSFFWTYRYARLYENILYSSLDENFKKKYFTVILLNKVRRRISVLKGFIKSFLKNKKRKK